MFFYKIGKKCNFNTLKEPIILFMVFFLPGFISQTQVVDGSVFNSAWFNMIYMITVIPQILLILYLIGKKPASQRSLYGLDRIKMKDLISGIIYFTGIMAIILIIGIILTFITKLDHNTIKEMPGWQFNNWKLIPLIFITCLTTGYSEELFFRSYLLTEFRMPGKEIYIITGTSLIFALGHIYQGLPGFLGTFAIGIFLASIFVRKRKLNTIAIAHGLYNFTVLIISGTIT